MHDVVVIGSGLAGSWVARELCAAGASVLILEAGPDLSPEQAIGNADSAAASVERLIQRHPVQSLHPSFSPARAHLFVDDLDYPYVNEPGSDFKWIRSRQVGGRSLLWGGACVRFEASDLDPVVADRPETGWPIPYEELLQAYSRIENFFGFSPDVGIDRLTGPEQQFKRTVERHPGLTVLPCSGLERPIAKNGHWLPIAAQGSALAAARASGQLEMRSRAVAYRLRVAPHGGRIAGVDYLETATGMSKFADARYIVLAASTIESARLLLMSRPGGLANSSGVVGRFLTDTPSLRFLGRCDGWPREAHAYDGPRSIYLPRLFADDEAQKVSGLATQARSGMQRKVPFVGEGDIASFMIVASHEMVPRVENRVVLDAEQHDCDGLPAARVYCAVGERERIAENAMRTRIRMLIKETGFTITDEIGPTAPGLFVHEAGTVRMGLDPRTSALGPDNRAWDHENLFVVDASSFPRASCRNPSLTIMALAARAGRRIATELGLKSEGV